MALPGCTSRDPLLQQDSCQCHSQLETHPWSNSHDSITSQKPHLQTYESHCMTLCTTCSFLQISTSLPFPTSWYLHCTCSFTLTVSCKSHSATLPCFPSLLLNSEWKSPCSTILGFCLHVTLAKPSCIKAAQAPQVPGLLRMVN